MSVCALSIRTSFVFVSSQRMVFVENTMRALLAGRRIIGDASSPPQSPAHPWNETPRRRAGRPSTRTT